MNEKELPPKYDPKAVEPKWYEQWEAGGWFRPEGNGAPYCVMIPPPNVTGSLHIGHALNNTLQDVLIRWKRMDGHKTLWQPGTDHAGIATQKVVSDLIAKTEKKTRWDLGREEFLKRVWAWKEESGGIIVRQLKRLGATPDWSRERFTMDEGLSRAVRQAFVSLFEKGLIQRDLSLTNWCPGKCRTVLSDLEVEHEDVPAQPPNPKRPIAEDFQKSGRLYHIRYPIAGSDESITVATTRPETMLGDTAVAVNPRDERYAKLVGKKVALPLTDRQIPIVADDYVDMTFGSGVVKITPAHDPNDFEVGKRHSLPQISIFDAEAKVNANGFAYAGLDRFEARKRVIKDLDAAGLLVKVEGHAMKIGHCQRCETVVEPMISTQWFVRTKPLAKPAIEAVKEGRTRFVPEERTKIYLHWMENIRDWCISRQLWWGHQIPAWYCESCDGARIRKSDIGVTVDVGATPIVSMTTPTACPKCKGSKLVQDPDVLDTWFSSGTWPFSTLGWPEKTPELATFYPTSTLVTGFDIIFFWVARMMMFGIEFMGDVPFKDVYIHGLVRDEKGEKMSKTKGNVVDPLKVMDEYGTDAMRFTLVALTQGNDMKLSMKAVEGNRNFANKIWNASRLLLMNLPEKVEEGPHGETLADRWILSRLQTTIENVRAALGEYRYADAAAALYQFTWSEFCDWYLEMIKPVLYKEHHAAKRAATQRTAAHVLDSLLRLLHPVMPFLTEEIWQKLPMKRPARSIMIAPYPVADAKRKDAAAEREAQLLHEAISAVRTIRSEVSINPASKLDLVIATSDGGARALLEREMETVTEMAKLAKVTFRAPGAAEKGSAAAVVGPLELFVPLEGHVDLAAERTRLEKEVAKLAKEREASAAKLSNEAYVSRAPKEIVEEQRAKLRTVDATIEKLKKSLELL